MALSRESRLRTKIDLLEIEDREDRRYRRGGVNININVIDEVDDRNFQAQGQRQRQRFDYDAPRRERSGDRDAGMSV